MFPRRKIVGTVLPMSALVSKRLKANTFAQGELFIDWLVKTKQTAWQLLPLHQTQLETGSTSKFVSSPYKGYGIGLDPRYLDLDSPRVTQDQIETFERENSEWLGNYALFCALRDQFGTDNWSKWPVEVRRRDPESLETHRRKLAPEIKRVVEVQAQLHRDYQRIKAKAEKNEILMVGDLPFYLSLASPLVWQYQDLFEITEKGEMRRVSGVPLGPKSHFGRQVWGHPLYNWQDRGNLRELTKLFQIRLKYLSNLFDWVRLDHAKGLFSYGVIDLADKSADRYLTGPGAEVLGDLIEFARACKLELYAEDTGDKLRELRECLRAYKLPGIRIFRFAYNEVRKKFNEQYLEISKYPTSCFAYTSSHDTETLLGYLEILSSEELSELMRRLGCRGSADTRELATYIRGELIQSPAEIVLIPLQDWLLTTERINIPGTEKECSDPNWQYKMSTVIEELP